MLSRFLVQEGLTHCLVVRPSEGSVWPWQSGLDVEFGICFWKRDAAQCSVVWEVTQGFDFFHGEACWSKVLVEFGCQHILVVRDTFIGVVRKFAQFVSRLAVDYDLLILDFGESGTPAWRESVSIFFTQGWSVCW